MKYITPDYLRSVIEAEDIITVSAEVTVDLEKDTTEVSVGVDQILALVKNAVE